MDFKEYQSLAQRTARKEMCLEKRLAVAAIGLVSEGGEAAEVIKKHIGHDHELDVSKLGKELGDVLWYIAEISHIIGYPLELVAKDNIEKLKQRYPDGFESDKSINRVEEMSQSISSFADMVEKNIMPILKDLPKAYQHSSAYGLMERQIINGFIRQEGENVPDKYFDLSSEEIIKKTLESINKIKQHHTLKMLRIVDVQHQDGKFYLYIRIFFEPKNKEELVNDKK